MLSDCGLCNHFWELFFTTDGQPNAGLALHTDKMQKRDALAAAWNLDAPVPSAGLPLHEFELTTDCAAGKINFLIDNGTITVLVPVVAVNVALVVQKLLARFVVCNKVPAPLAGQERMKLLLD